jgi:spermidine synthase
MPAHQTRPYSGQTAHVGHAVYLAVLSLLAFSFMLFQMSVLRELRYTMYTLFTLTPFLFSAVVFLIGLGSCAGLRVSAGTRAVLQWCLVILPIVFLPLFALTVALSQYMNDRPELLSPVGGDYIGTVGRTFITVAIFGYGPVFFLQGLIFALYFREGRRDGILSRLYALDLIASGVAALVGGILASYATPVECVLLASAVLVVTLWLARGYLALPRWLVAAATLGALALIVGERATGAVARLEAPKWPTGTLAFSTWTPYRHIDVRDEGGSLTVYADGGRFQFYDKDDRTHEADLRVVPSLLAARDDDVKRVLVIGSGSGADVRVLRNRISRPLEITAVELDPGFIRTARAFPSLWAPYQTARIVVGEGRYFLERTRRTFDMIIYAYLDPQAGVSKLGIPDTNFLYTDAGIRKAYARLRPGGYFVLNRLYLDEQDAAFFSQLCATLRSAGIHASEISLHRSVAAVPWASLGHLRDVTVVVRKGGPAPTLNSRLLTPVAWVDGGRPTTDFYPFSVVVDAWFGTLWDYVKSRAAVAAVLAALGLLLLGRLATSLGHGYFFFLGLASFLVESLVLLNSFLMFGNPSLSAALAIGFFLLWSGIGSQFSERLQAWRGFYWFVPAAVLLYGVTGPLVHAATMGSSMGIRSVAFALNLVVVGVTVGAMFPISLRAFSREAVAGMLFIDLVGCAVAPIVFWLMMSVQGVPLVICVSVVLYAGLVAVLSRRA